MSITESFGSAVVPGSLQLPSQASLVGATLVSYDPQREAIAGLLKATINAHHQAAWSKVTMGLPSNHFLRGTLPIADVMLLDAGADTMGQRRPKFPILAVSRQGEAQMERVTLKACGLRQQWHADVILGPITAGDQRIVGDILMGISASIRSAVRHGFHPSYGTGRPFAVPAAEFGIIKIIGPSWGAVEGVTEPYYGLTAVLETLEMVVDIPDPADVPLEGMDLTLGLAVDPLDGVTLPNFIKAKF